MNESREEAPLIAVTGATGYIGGRLAPRLLDEGYRVRCLARDPGRLAARPWSDRVEIRRADLLKPANLDDALRGAHTAFYLVHSMAGGPDFERRDVEAARAFSLAAASAGVQRIIYLGALGDPASDLSHHLRSRQETGAALRCGGTPVTELRAGVIVGSGSLSFEMIRYLVERVPLMICPRWVYTRTQPMAVRNVLDYLVGAVRGTETAGQVIEIGGADTVTYGDMMRIYAEVRGLRRVLLPVPVLTPRLSSYWVHLVTPVPAAIARPLIQGLRNEVVVRDTRARELFPEIQPISYREAVRLALARLQDDSVETAWSDALSSSAGGRAPVALTSQEGLIIERRQRLVGAAPAQVHRIVAGLGGARGWIKWNWAWRIRGAADRLLGGVGMRRGRRHPDDLRPGDAVDFWRVEAIEPDRLLRFRAEMKVPGRAWLQFETQPAETGGCLLTQSAFFAPKGLWGLLYWYALYPVHALIFAGMIAAIGEAARSASRGRPGSVPPAPPGR